MHRYSVPEQGGFHIWGDCGGNLSVLPGNTSAHEGLSVPCPTVSPFNVSCSSHLCIRPPLSSAQAPCVPLVSHFVSHLIPPPRSRLFGRLCSGEGGFYVIHWKFVFVSSCFIAPVVQRIHFPSVVRECWHNVWLTDCANCGCRGLEDCAPEHRVDWEHRPLFATLLSLPGPQHCPPRVQHFGGVHQADRPVCNQGEARALVAPLHSGAMRGGTPSSGCSASRFLELLFDCGG